MVIFSKDALCMLTKPNKNVFEKYPIVRFNEEEQTIWEFPIIYYLQSCYNMLYLYIDIFANLLGITFLKSCNLIF